MESSAFTRGENDTLLCSLQLIQEIEWSIDLTQPQIALLCLTCL
jgi:hypothetical protein